MAVAVKEVEGKQGEAGEGDTTEEESEREMERISMAVCGVIVECWAVGRDNNKVTMRWTESNRTAARSKQKQVGRSGGEERVK